MFKTTLTAAAFGLALAASPAMAGDDKPSTTIEFKDLNLSTAEGQAILDKRIDMAARAMCKVDQVTTGTRVRSADRVACYKAAKKSAKQQVAALVEQERRGG